MMIKTKKLDYLDDQLVLMGHYAFDDLYQDKRPVVLICPDWSGCNEFARKKAEQLAELGYVGFALDFYGNGQLGQDNAEKTALMKPLMEDRKLILRRLQAALAAVKKIEVADLSQVAVIGFCFGGLCALDFARSGAEIAGVVSFHGLLGAPAHSQSAKIQAKILALHGHDDPMAPPAQVLAFQEEMTKARADWQMVIYGNTKHAFTNPLANDPDFGTVYNVRTADRAWIAMKNFLVEIFPPIVG